MIVEMFCSKCGKNFIPAPEHLYRDRRGWYCSYTCWIHSDDGKKQGKPPKMVAQCTPDGEVVRIHASSQAAADFVNYLNGRTITNAIRSKKLCKGYLWKYVDGGNL